MQEEYVRGQIAPLDATQRRALLGDTRRLLAAWLQFAPRAGRSGYEEVLRFKGLVGRAEAAERVVARRAGPDEAALRDRLVALQRRVASLANQIPPGSDPVERTHWQETYAEAREEQTAAARALSERLSPLKAARERFEIGLAAIQARIAKDAALVDMLKVGEDRYLAWVVRASGAPVRVDLGMAEPIDAACGVWTRAIMSEDEDALHEIGSDLRDLVWEPIEDVLGPGVTRLILCTDSALASIPFAALPGAEPGKRLLDERALSHVMYAQDLVPSAAAAPGRGGALLVGDVDYDAAEGTPAAAEGGAAPTRPAKGFEPLSQTQAEIDALRALLGDGAEARMRRRATEAALREGSKGRRFVHVATHGFARQDLQAGLRRPKGARDWTDVFLERRLALGHDPLALSGLALAGANPRAGGGDDDGIFTALEASYLDLDGVDLVTLSACETARGSVAVGEGVLGLVSAFQMAGARDVLASLWRVDDEATRRLMEGLYARMLRKESPLGPAEALRESALALRDTVEPDGKRRFAGPRYWAAFVAYGR
jgi:CHAT domain-containing protein